MTVTWSCSTVQWYIEIEFVIYLPRYPATAGLSCLARYCLLANGTRFGSLASWMIGLQTLDRSSASIESPYRGCRFASSTTE